MKTSNQGINLLIEREGKRNQAYRDSEGFWTIGVGHLLSHNKNDDFSGTVWSDAQVETVLRGDLARFEDAVNSGVGQGTAITQNQFDALVSFSFNIGVQGFLGSTVLRKVRAGDLNGAARAFDMWHIPESIISRRNGEREQFLGNQFSARII